MYVFYLSNIMKSFSNSFIFVLVMMLMLWKSVSTSIELDNSKGNSEGNSEGDSDVTWDKIFPGTKWCGQGSNAKNYDDLGEKEALDKCCRAHDTCPGYMESNTSLHGLKNDSKYTRLPCECENAFRQCLLKNIKEEKNKICSIIIGYIYFHWSKTQCFKLEHKIVKCLQRTKFTNRCSEYELDMNSEKIWQWFDVVHFKED